LNFPRKLLPVVVAAVLLAGGLVVIRKFTTKPPPRRPSMSVQAQAVPAASSVILLANRDDPDSLRIAEHYAERRGVPKENIIAQSMPQTETITWPEFVATVWQPLQDELVRRKWIDAMPMALTDSVGRKKYVIGGHRISYLVVCRGVPLSIANSAELTVRRPPPFDRPELRPNEGAVDSELSLLAVTDYPINGFVPNPLFHNDTPAAWQRAQVVKVSRLDGPTVEDALALVDHAIAAERTGLLGRAYVDVANKHPDGDRWLESDAAQLAALGFDLDVDRASTTIPVTARFDAPVLYFGWYAGDLTGPFTLPGFQFPPGAIAVHIHSFSANTLRSSTSGWCGPFVARGVTATVGNVFEPYLDFLHRPDLLLQALARGDTFGDAAYYAEPVLSWQAIAIGDPLYRPFGPAFWSQWRNRDSLPPALAGYAALNESHRLEMQQTLKVSFAEVEKFQKERPSLVLGLALAKRHERAGDPAGAARELAGFVLPEKFRADEWSLAREAAQLLQRVRALVRAEQVYAHLLQDSALPPELREPCLREGSAVAQAAGDADQALSWARELGQLAPDEKK
jgi:uncharacterized protein (TIGR03790 family)